jgi:ABC-type sugar transport system substrate-binding protein
MADIDDCAAQLAKGIAMVNPLFDDFPKLNKTLADAGVPYMTVDTTNVPAPVFGRGGGR